MARRRGFLVLMFLSLIPFLVRVVMLYVKTMLPSNARFLEITPKFFEDFLSQQTWFFTFAVAVYAGAGLIANDFKANALQIYLSKPITRRDYVIGKLGVLVFFLALTTLVPALLLVLIAMLFQPTPGFFARHFWVAGSVTLYALVIIFTYAFCMLALSSLSRSSRFAGINFLGVLFFSQILYTVLRQMLRTDAVAWISLGNNLTQVGDFLFGTPAQYRSPVWLSALLLLLLMGGCAWVVHRRVRAVEVVK